MTITIAPTATDSTFPTDKSFVESLSTSVSHSACPGRGAVVNALGTPVPSFAQVECGAHVGVPGGQNGDTLVSRAAAPALPPALAGGLDTTGTVALTVDKDQAKQRVNRRRTWRRMNASRKFLTPLAKTMDTGFVKRVTPARCGSPLSNHVGIMSDGSRPAGYAGLERCSSIWACPSCSAVIRAGRSKEIEEVVEKHQATGGSVVFFTGTQRHHLGDALKDTVDISLRAWGRILRNTPWRVMKKRFGISGYIRATEITGNFGEGGHGWHPHIHALIFFDRALSSTEFEALRGKLFAEWTRSVEALGGRPPTDKGLDLQKVDNNGKVLARYLGKVQEAKEPHKWGVGAEVARFDVKRGRTTDSFMPFQLLDGKIYTKNRCAQLWREYYLATKGRRAITWSRGLKARYQIGDQTDEELLFEDEPTTLVWRTSAKDFRKVSRSSPELLAVALELAEDEKWAELEKILPYAGDRFGDGDWFHRLIATLILAKCNVDIEQIGAMLILEVCAQSLWAFD